MERRGPKARKRKHEEENRDKTPEPESEVTPKKRKISSAKGDTAEKVDDPKKEPQLDRDKVIREQRKRHAPPLDVVPPKKPAPPLVTEPTAAGTDKSSVDEVLALQVGNLSIGQRRRDYRLEKALPRPQSVVLVSRERSGYLIAQASFLVPSSESASGSGGPGASGNGGPGASGSVSLGVPGSGGSSAYISGGSDPSGSGSSSPSISSYAGVHVTEWLNACP